MSLIHEAIDRDKHVGMDRAAHLIHIESVPVFDLSLKGTFSALQAHLCELNTWELPLLFKHREVANVTRLSLIAQVDGRFLNLYHVLKLNQSLLLCRVQLHNQLDYKHLSQLVESLVVPLN